MRFLSVTSKGTAAREGDMMASQDNETFLKMANYSAISVLQEYKHQDRWFDSATEVSITIAYCTIILLGLVGNGIVCIIVGRKEKLHSTKNFLIVNLSISDIMMCVISMPFTLLKLILKNWPLGKIVCKLMPFVHMTDIFVSTATIVAIAIGRYRCIVHAKSRSTSKRTVFYTVVIIWAVSMILALPVFIFSEVKSVKIIHEMVQYHICMEDWPNGKIRCAYTILLVLVQYLLPVVVISSLHAKICHFLRQRITENPITARKFERSFRAIQRHRKNMTLLTAIALAFGISWLPLTILNVMADYNYRIFLDSNFNLAYAICHLLAMLSASVNPIIYGWLNPNFRDEFLYALFYWGKKRKDHSAEGIEEGHVDITVRQAAPSSLKSQTPTQYQSLDVSHSCK